jgi:hypothetical protein
MVALLGGWAYERSAFRNFLAADALTGIIGVLIFFMVSAATRARGCRRLKTPSRRT